MPPLITKERLEKELSCYIGNNVWERIKVQCDLSKSFENRIRIADNQLSITEFNLFIEQSENINTAYWDQLVEKYRCISGISIPVFSEDYNYALVYEYTMYEPAIGGGSIRIYQKENKRWVLVKTLNEWIS